MGLDIRLPIGLLFLILGALLSLYGLLTLNDAAVYAKSLGDNINLWWGACLLVFGAVMFFYGRRATAQNATEGMHQTADSKEGRETEAREHSKGLEK
jgi:multisubunit Na+/H+ antiporter MnhG subunit